MCIVLLSVGFHQPQLQTGVHSEGREREIAHQEDSCKRFENALNGLKNEFYGQRQSEFLLQPSVQSRYTIDRKVVLTTEDKGIVSHP